MATVHDKREAIFKATLKMVDRLGFHGASVAKIAKEAGVSAGIIYHYFKNKDELLLELFWECERKVIGVARETIDPSLSLQEQLRCFCVATVKSNLLNPAEVQYIQQFSASPYNTNKISKALHEEHADVMSVIEQAKIEKIVKDLPESVCASLFMDFVACVGQRNRRGEFELTEEVEGLIVELIWDAMKY